MFPYTACIFWTGAVLELAMFVMLAMVLASARRPVNATRLDLPVHVYNSLRNMSDDLTAKTDVATVWSCESAPPETV